MGSKDKDKEIKKREEAVFSAQHLLGEVKAAAKKEQLIYFFTKYKVVLVTVLSVIFVSVVSYIYILERQERIASDRAVKVYLALQHDLPITESAIGGQCGIVQMIQNADNYIKTGEVSDTYSVKNEPTKQDETKVIVRSFISDLQLLQHLQLSHALNEEAVQNLSINEILLKIIMILDMADKGDRMKLHSLLMTLEESISDVPEANVLRDLCYIIDDAGP